MNIVTILVLCLGVSYIFSSILKRFRLPVVLGPILLGLILGIPPIKAALFSNNLELMASFSEIGLIFLMFYIGLQISAEEVKTNLKADLLPGILIFVIPFMIGFSLAFFLQLGLKAAVVIGIIFSIIAEAVPIGILKDLKLLKHPVGEKMVFLGAFSDVLVGFEFLIVATMVGVAQEFSSILITMILQILIFATAVYVAVFVVTPFILSVLEHTASRKELFVLSLIMVFALAATAEYLQFGAIVGALVAGIVVRTALVNAHEAEPEEELEEFIDLIAFGLFAPFFYIWIGLNTDITSVFASPMLGILLIIGFFAAKFLASFAANLFFKRNMHETIALGWGIAILGGEELIFAEIARSNGLISNQIFSAIVLLSVVTVMIAPVLLEKLLKGMTTKGQ